MTKHTEIAAQLFPISGETVNSEILRSLILIKKGAAEAQEKKTYSLRKLRRERENCRGQRLMASKVLTIMRRRRNFSKSAEEQENANVSSMAGRISV